MATCELRWVNRRWHNDQRAAPCLHDLITRLEKCIDCSANELPANEFGLCERDDKIANPHRQRQLKPIDKNKCSPYRLEAALIARYQRKLITGLTGEGTDGWLKVFGGSSAAKNQFTTAKVSLDKASL